MTWRPGALALLFLVAAPTPSSAQDLQPGDERQELPAFRSETEGERQRSPLPEVPPFEPEPARPGDALPHLMRPESGGTGALEAGARIEIREVRISGNTALPDPALRQIASRYENRPLGLAEIEALRDEVTRAYVDRGYVTSGAVVPPQSLEDGVLDLQVVEGTLADIEVETDGRFRESYLRRRLARAAGSPVNVASLRERLLLFQQDDRIRSVQARLLPTDEIGKALLRVEVDEHSPFVASLAGNNYTTPSLGEGSAEIGLGYGNVTGFGDAVFADYRWSPGLHDVRGSYDIPFTDWDTRLELSGRATWAEIIEHPFDQLDIESETQSYAVGLYQPVLRSAESDVELFAHGEYRRIKSFLFGDPFSFSVGPEHGVAKLALLRAGAQWTHRSARVVWAVRGQVTGGLDALGATRNSDPSVPDGRFVAGLLQLQCATRLPWLGLQLLARADGQIADDPLLGLEQFSIGGRYTVRGYRENQIVRDNGVVGGAELRIPVPAPRIGDWAPRLALAPFYDVGYASNNRRDPFPRGEDRVLESVGIGLLMEIVPRLDFEIYYGESLRPVRQSGEWSLQDESVHLQLRWGFHGWPLPWP